MSAGSQTRDFLPRHNRKKRLREAAENSATGRAQYPDTTVARYSWQIRNKSSENGIPYGRAAWEPDFGKHNFEPPAQTWCTDRLRIPTANGVWQLPEKTGSQKLKATGH